MTTSQTDNDAKKLGGYLKEKLTIAMTRFSDDELVRAVTKVTSHMLKIPNEKHMQRLINATFGQFNSGGTEYDDVNKWIVENLESHLHAHNWVVVLKSALAFHRLMQDGSDAFNAACQIRRGLFSLSHVKDLADSPDGAEQQIFITNYLRYLEERQLAQNFNHARLKGMRIENQAFANQLLSVTGREAVTVTSALLLQFETAIDVQFLAHAVNNFATLQGHRNCLNDAKLLFVAISRKMVSILEKIEFMTSEERESWLPIYKRYSVSSRKFAGKLNEMKSSRVSWGEALPTIRALPDDILEQLAMMLDPKYQGPSTGPAGANANANNTNNNKTDLAPGEIPRARLSDITRGGANNSNDDGGNPPILDGRVIMGNDANNNNNNGFDDVKKPVDSNKAMHDIFSPEKGGNNNNNNNNNNRGGAAAGGGMPDLFNNGPTKPNNNNNQNNNNVDNRTVDLFGNNNNSNQSNNNNNNGLAPPPQRGGGGGLDDLFGGPSTNNNNQQRNTNNNNNVPAHNDLFGSSSSTNNRAISNVPPAQKAHTLPVDPFAGIGAGGQAHTSSNSNNNNNNASSSSTSPSTNNNNNGNSNFVDFFAAPSSQNNNNNQNNNNRTNNNNNNTNPAFDPFAAPDSTGRQPAW